MMVGAILTQNTAWANVEKAIGSLKASRALSLSRIATLPLPRLEKLIRASGFFRQKAGRLQAFARYLRDHPTFYRQLKGGGNLHALREQLLSLNGIGPETADSILLYAGDYPVFVVDAYTRRIGQRLGLFRFNGYDDIQAFFQQALPKRSAMYNEYHALLVELAKVYCKRRNPLCEKCPVSATCRYPSNRQPLAAKEC